MMVFINAFKSISRAKGRNILIGIIVLTIAVSSSVALAIRNSAEVAKESGFEAQTITGTISVDRQKMMEGMQGGSGGSNRNGMRDLMQQYAGLSLGELQEYANSDYVKDFYYTASSSLDAGGELEPYSSTETSTNSNSGSQNAPGGRDGIRGVGVIGSMAMGDFSVTGYSDENAMGRFISGDSKITDGEMFDFTSEDLNCLISYELAIFNDLSVGDILTLANPNDEEETYSFTITGIYTNATSTDTGGQMQFSTAMDPANLICVSFNALSKLAEESELNAVAGVNEYGIETTTALNMQTAGTYAFSSKDNYDNFDRELRVKGLSEYYVLSSPDMNSYEASLVPLENLSNFALTLMIIILIVGAVILIVLNIFNIRERKYEVGVLTAIGIKKTKVAAQFVIELLVITLTAVTIGTGIGAVVSVPVSNNLLESQIQSQELTQTTQEQNFGRPGGDGGGNRIQGGFLLGGAEVSVEYVDTINATINVSILLQLIGIGIFLTVFSSLVGIVFVLRYDPLKILANRA